MNIHDLYEQRSNFLLSPSGTARGGLIFCILVGVVAFVGGMYAGEATRTWGSFLFNLFFFFSLALGGLAFSGMQDTIGATWGRPIMRLHESFASFLPIAVLLFVGFFACIQFQVGQADEVYKWIKDPHILDHFWGKKTWLQKDFMLIRDTVTLVMILLLALWQLKTKLKGDVALLKGDQDKALEYGTTSKYKLRHWSAPILVFYALGFSLLAFDLLMTLPTFWFSTLWAAWSFSIMMQTLMASLLIVMFIFKKTPIGQYIGRSQFHDVGKLMHGFTIFFAYLTYAHVLTYWYGNVPEETEYFIHRLHGPWLTIILITPILVFVIPLFALIPKASKWTAAFTVPLCVSILFAQWLVNLVVVMPDVTDGSKWTFPWIEIGVFLGVLGLFLSSIIWFGRRYPMLAVSDPLLQQSFHAEH